MTAQTCYQCGKTYNSLGMHWRRGECSYPEITDRQHRIIQGCLMGDGHLDFGNKSPKFHVSNTNREFLQWLKTELQEHISRIYLHATAERQSESFEEHGMGEWSCSDVYRLSSMTLRTLERYSEWYPEDGVSFPSDLELTPETLTVWYCCDGTLTDDEQIRIGTKNEMHREDFLTELFSEYHVDPTLSTWNLCFTKEETQRLFDVMEDAPDGMEDKWL